MKYTRLLILLSALLAPAGFAAIPTALPSFKSEKQLSTWRAEQAMKSTTASASGDSVFYNGKPYVHSSKGYAFKCRNYLPDQSRWASEDPSGFPDGANPYLYVNNSVLDSIDPDGLQRVVVSETYKLTITTTITGSMASAYIDQHNIVGTSPGPLNTANANLYQEWLNKVNYDYPVGAALAPGQISGTPLYMDSPTQVTLNRTTSKIDSVTFSNPPASAVSGFTITATILSSKTYTYE